MPTLSNPRHERFAQELARGSNATEAYRAAGFSAHRQNAARLMTRDDIRTRVEELQGRAAEGLVISLQWLLEKAEEARAGAMQAGQHAAAVSAIKELGILSGLRVEKREQTNRSMDEMTDDELLAIARGDAGSTHH